MRPDGFIPITCIAANQAYSCSKTLTYRSTVDSTYNIKSGFFTMITTNNNAGLDPGDPRGENELFAKHVENERSYRTGDSESSTQTSYSLTVQVDLNSGEQVIRFSFLLLLSFTGSVRKNASNFQSPIYIFLVAGEWSEIFRSF